MNIFYYLIFLIKNKNIDIKYASKNKIYVIFVVVTWSNDITAPGKQRITPSG